MCVCVRANAFYGARDKIDERTVESLLLLYSILDLFACIFESKLPYLKETMVMHKTLVVEVKHLGIRHKRIRFFRL